MLVNATGVGGGSLQDLECGRRRDLIVETHGISNSIPFEADISRGRLHHQPSGYITMEWRVQQHASEAVESTASSATSTIQTTSLSAARMKKSMEEFIPD